MAEKKEVQFENIKNLGSILKEEGVASLLNRLKSSQESLVGVKKALSEKGKAFSEARAERERLEREAAEQAEEAAKAAAKAAEPEPVRQPAEQPAETEIKAEPKAEEPKPEPVVSEKPAEAPAVPAEPKPEVPAVKAEPEQTPPVPTPAPASAPVQTAGARDRAPQRQSGDRDRQPYRQREFVPREGANRDRPPRQGVRPDQRPPRPGQGLQGGRPQQGARPGQGQGMRPGGARPQGVRPGKPFEAPRPVAPAPQKPAPKKKDKPYEEKKTLSKRALVKQQVSVADFDENKTGYRKLRPAKKQKQQTNEQFVRIEHAVITTEVIPLKVLSEKLGISAIEITKRLFKEGIMKTINDSVDFDTAEYIASDLGITLELKLEKTAEDVLADAFGDDAEDDTNLVKRPPVVTVMGHVDHGKTSLLDRIRKTNVTAGEAGGITQHIGAYQVSVGGKVITFLDTPGHAAFTAMRMRGAQATDIAVIVIAADDGIMPQTIEAISHAKAAGVSVIVAANKIDKPEANLERVKTQLTEHDLLPEEWGGDIMVCPVSAKTGEGIDNLLESINLIAEMKELKANPERKAKGVVIEAKLDQSRGPVATILIQNGTLKVSDSIVVGTVIGKVRAMTDDKGRRITAAGPSTPVSIMGLDDVPNAGDTLFAVEQEKLTKLVAEERKNKEKFDRMKESAKVTLDDVFNKIAEGQVKGLNVIVKADVQGSVEAVKASLEKLSNEEARVNVIHAAAGAINETDIMLADSSSAIIIGFNVRPDSNAKTVAERSGVDIKLYRVIYEAIEDVERALKGMLAPKYKETYMGKAEVRNTFKITGVGTVAGCYVTEGKIVRNGKLRIYRDDVMICEGNVLQLKRFKDDVKEVAQGFECGISIEKFNDINIGDFIECYVIEEVKN